MKSGHNGIQGILGEVDIDDDELYGPVCTVIMWTSAPRVLKQPARRSMSRSTSTATAAVRMAKSRRSPLLREDFVVRLPAHTIVARAIACRITESPCYSAPTSNWSRYLSNGGNNAQSKSTRQACHLPTVALASTSGLQELKLLYRARCNFVAHLARHSQKEHEKLLLPRKCTLSSCGRIDAQ